MRRPRRCAAGSRREPTPRSSSRSPCTPARVSPDGSRELARAERLKSEVSLMVMDLDNFKDINDNHGHHVGDRALCEVARVLRAAIRPYDICVRYAGDEFIVVLSGCGADEAEHKRQELQKSIDDVYFEARPGKRLQLGISVGAAVFPQDGE